MTTNLSDLEHGLEEFVHDRSPNGTRSRGLARVSRVADVPAERVQWLWPGRLPRGKLVVLDGDPALGKSTLTLDWSARVSTASPWPDGSRPGDPAAVVLMSAEDGIADTIRPRLAAAGADLDRIFVLTAVEEEGRERPPRIPADLQLLQDWVEFTGAALVVVDVLAAFLDSRVDSYRDQDVRGALLPLARLADETGAVVVVLRHLSKTGGTKAVYRGGGSIGIIGAARAGFLVAPEPENDGQIILAMTKNNLAPIADALAYRLVTDQEHDCARVSWEGSTRHTAGDLLAVDGEERTARDAAGEFLTDLLADGPVPAKRVKALARDAGIADRTLDRARQRVGASTRREGFGAGATYVWELDPSTPPEPHARHVRQGSGDGEQGEHGEHVSDDLGAWCSDTAEMA